MEDVGGYIKYHNNITANREYFVNHTLHLKPTMPPRNEPLYFSPATWYLFSMIGFFFLTALLHGFEFTGLIHGIWYLLCLPSGYLLLVIYSAANLTDRSWGMLSLSVIFHSLNVNRTTYPSIAADRAYGLRIFYGWLRYLIHLSIELDGKSRAVV